MPTAVFAADFSDFQSAVTKADVSLKAFETGAGKVEKSLTSMSNSLSGTKLIQDATLAAEAVERIGGVSKLTEAELQKLSAQAKQAVEKLQAMGQTVPAGIQKIADATKDATKQTQSWKGALTSAAGAFGIAFSVGAVVAFGKSIFDAAGQVNDLALQIGISTDAVQGFKFAAEQSGSSLDAVGTAITKMNQNLAQGDKSTVAALASVGLSFEAIRNMAPEDAFLTITDAIQQIPDPMKQTEVALQLFGKSAAQLLPAIKEGFRGVAEGADKMSADTIKALDDAGDAWAKLGNKVTIYSGTIIAAIANVVTQTTKSVAEFGMFADNVIKFGIGGATAMARIAAEAERGGNKAKDVYLGTAKATGAATDATKAHTAAVQEAIALSSQELAIQALIERAKQNEAASVRFAASEWKAWETTVSKALQSIANNPSLPLLQGRNMSGIGAAIAAPGTSFTLPPSVKEGFFASLFGTSNDFGKALSASILGAIQGGGNPIAAAAGMVGSTIGGGIAKSLTKEGGKLFQTALGGVLSSALPVIGSLVGPLVGALWGKLFGSAGRDLVKDFAGSMGGFDALREQLNALGAEGEKLWIALTQGVGKNNPKEAQKAIDAITAALEKQKSKQEETAAAAAETAAAQVKAQQDALDAITEKYAGTISKLEAEYKSLTEAVSQEAEEEAMGVVETQQRARMKQIEAEKAAQEAMRDAEIAAKKSTFEQWVEDGQKTYNDLKEIFGKTLKIPYEFVQKNTPGGDGGGATYAPSGSAGRGGGGSVTVPVYLDGAVLTTVVAKRLPTILRQRGLVG